jgi:hypothetical protein
MRGASHGEATRQPSRRSLLFLLGGVIGGVTLGGTVGALMERQGDGAAAEIETLPTDALPQAEGTLAPEAAAGLIERARQCREPLARVVLWHGPQTAGGMVSIASGAYQSPRFVLTSAPRLVALPFPAPYPTGRGVISLIGQARDVTVSLAPSRTLAALDGSFAIPVRWTPVRGCP